MPTDTDEQEQQLKHLLEGIIDLTAQIQTDMSCALLKNESVVEKTSELAKENGNKTLERTNAAIYAFVDILPIASINSINLFMVLIGYHSVLTGNPQLSKLIAQISEERDEYAGGD